MIDVINIDKNTTYYKPVDYTYVVKLEALRKGEKISLFSDTMFKTMFQNENRIKYSCKLLSYYLNISYKELLENLRLSENELDKEYEKDVSLRCDYVANIRGISINIEVNNNSSIETMERNIEYAYRLYANQVKRGKRNKYTKVIQFNLNNFAFKNNDKIVDIYSIQNEEKEKLSDKIIIVQIYIPNIRKKWYTSGIESLNEGEKFILGLIEPNIEESIKLGKDIKEMEEYIKEATYVSRDELILESYDKEWALKDQGKREGYEEGYEEGKTKGLKKGIKQREKDIVISMLKKELDIKLISEITNLSEKEIIKIKESIDKK